MVRLAKKASIIPLWLVILSIFSTALLPQVNAQTNDLNSIKIRVYIGGFDPKNIASKTALYHLFEWMEADVDWISAEDILNGALEEIDLLAMPAISPYTINDESIAAGGEVYEVRTMIQDFIKEGGAYFGIYGGAYFEWNAYPLFDVRLTFPNPNVSGTQEINEIDVEPSIIGSMLPENTNDSLSLLTWAPGYFKSYGTTKFITIASYPENGLPAMVCFNLGEGRVFISSPHPEHEEESSRDGTDYYDYLDDPDSEWYILRSITEWLVSKKDIVIFWTVCGSFGGFFIIAILYITLNKRRRK